MTKTETLNYGVDFESKLEGYEGTIIQIEKEGDDCISVRFETDDYECGMYVYRTNEVWEPFGYDTDLYLWTADGALSEYSDDHPIYEFIEEAIKYWAEYGS